MTVKTTSLLLLFGLLFLGEHAFAQKSAPEAKPDASSVKEISKPDFDKTGPQVGEQVPDLRLHTMKGEEQRLSAAWEGGPALLVTSSLTCPKSRSRWPELKALVDKYEDKLNVVIVYVIEAHPVGSPCPYKGVEDITPENQRDGILRKQPKSLEDRLELAQEFRRLLRINTPIYVDNIKDEAWKGLGAAPNLALLVDREGTVVSRSGWFEGTKSQEAIDNSLEAPKKEEATQETRGDELDRRSEVEGVYAALDQAGFESPEGLKRIFRHEDRTKELASMLKAVPRIANLTFETEQGHPYAATMLMEAALEKNTAGVKVLLEAGADVKARTETYDSALQIAARIGDLESARLLLAKGADPAFPTTGQSPLHEAAVNGHTEMVKLLLSAGLRHDFHSAIALGEIEMIRKGLKADPSRALRPDGAGRMPLDYAAANGQLEIAKLLVGNGAPIVRDEWSELETPLHRAITGQDVAMVEWLLAVGSSPSTKVSRRGEYAKSTPALHHAVAQNNLPIVKLLIAHNVDLTARDNYSQTALHDAASTGQAEIAAALIAAGADVNSPQLGFHTPCGDDDEAKPTNRTPLHFAAAWGNPATMKTLLAGGAKLEALTRHGETPLLFALKSRPYGYDPKESTLPNIAALIAAGAEVNAQDRDKNFVLDWAEDARGGDPRSLKQQEAIIALLKTHGAKGTPRPAPAPASEKLPAEPNTKPALKPVPKTPATEDPFG